MDGNGEVCAEGPVGIVLTLLALHTIHPFVHPHLLHAHACLCNSERN